MRVSSTLSVERRGAGPAEVARVGIVGAALTHIIFVPGNPGVASYYTSTAEMLAYQFSTRNMCPIQPMSITDSPEQVAYVDARTEQTQTSQVQKTTEAASTHEAAVPAPVAQPTISPEQLQLPEAPTFPGLTENIPSQEDDDPLVSEAPSAKKTKLTAEPELRVGDIAMPSTAEDPVSRTPLEVHLENISQGLDDPGQRLARKLASTQKSGASTARERSRSVHRDIPDHVAHMAVSVEDPELQQCFEGFDQWRAFMAKRIESDALDAYVSVVNQAKGIKKKKSLEKRGKLINYNKVDTAIQKLMMEARLKEWNNYKSFKAVRVISEKEARDLVDLGAEELPTQWIETDKNETLRFTDPSLPYKAKARLVAMGNFSKQFGRTDSPTADNESIYFVFSFAASKKLKVKSGDLDHGYFQGEKLTRPLVLRQPRGGLPDEHINATDKMLALVPIYGTKDAGRGLWKKVVRILAKHGLKENHIFNALYSFQKNGVVHILMATHVDDFLYANTEEAESIVKALWEELMLGSNEEVQFRFCGKEIVQDLKTFDIRVYCKATAEKLGMIRISQERAKQIESPLTTVEHEAFQSVVGSLMWICRSCRPSIAYRVSELQTATRKPIVEDLQKANKVIKHCKDYPDECLTFRSGVIEWPTDEDDGEVNVCTLSVSDASHGQEDEYLPEEDVREPFRSQGAKLNFLGSKEVLTEEECGVHIISFGSNIVTRVCNSTIKAETYQLQHVVENGDLVRAAFADMHGALRTREWETSSAAYMMHIWFTDCKSAWDHLQKPVPKKRTDKRLGIEMAALRQSLWRKRGEALGDPRLYDALPVNPTDICHWIDTDVMICDPLTKAMKADKLLEVLATNRWRWTQSKDAKELKARKAQHRRNAKDRKQDAADKQATAEQPEAHGDAPDPGHVDEPDPGHDGTEVDAPVRGHNHASCRVGSDATVTSSRIRLPPLTGTDGRRPHARM